MPELKIARGFTLPLSTVTEVLSVIATRGAGKTFGSAVVTEELFAASLQFVVIDPMGVYYGLRSGADGGAGGLPIIVLGGERGDVPLEPTSGKLIADVVVESGQSFVLDLSYHEPTGAFESKAQQTRFVTDFAERLYTRKSPLEARTPIMVVMDEADEFAPQRPGSEGNEAKMLGAIIRLAKRGRSRGIGLMAITQRSAEFSKAVLDLSSAVVFMRMAGPRDRRVIRDWLKGHDPELVALADTDLPKLDTGEAIIYSPHWLNLDEPKRIKFRQIKTFDSYKTPEGGAARPAPKATAEIDLTALGEQIRATAERAKENDPKLLQQRVVELERELVQRPTEQQIVEKEVPVEVPVISQEQIDALKKIKDEIMAAFAIPEPIIGELRAVADPLLQAISKLPTEQQAAILREKLWSPVKEKSGPPKKLWEPGSPPPQAVAENGSGDEVKLNRKAERMILAALAQYPEGRTKRQVAIQAGYAMSGGGFNQALGKLRKVGYIEDTGLLRITQTGRDAIEGQWEPLPTGHNLLLHWLGQFNRAAERAVLQAVYNAYPDSISKNEIAAQAGYEPAGGGFNQALGKNKTLGLIAKVGDEFRATDVFFGGVGVAP